jgi:hypothetical protein
MKNGTEILTGWTLSFEEVSNNVYKVKLTDKFGREVETTDFDLDKALTTVEKYAFDIEKQISKNWNKFLYDTCVLKLQDKVIVEKHYTENAYCSWFILLNENKIILDGRDFYFCLQVHKNHWVDIETVKMSELTLENFINVIKLAQ